MFFILFLNIASFAFANNYSSLYSKLSKEKDDEIVAKFKETTPWGMNVSINLHSADAIIGNPVFYPIG